MTQQPPPLPFSRILCYTDFTPAALHAFSVAAALAQHLPHPSLSLLHVIPEPPAQFWKAYIYEVDDDVDANAKTEIDAKINAHYRPLVPPSIPFSVVMRIGEPFQNILDYAQTSQSNLLVIGRPATAVGKWLSRHLARRINRKVQCPLLVIPFTPPPP